MSTPITPDEIVRTVFPSGSRANAYDSTAVDDFLDSVVGAMRSGTFDPTVCADVEFPSPRGLGARGYACASVDTLLDRIADSPASPERHGRKRSALPDAGPRELTEPSSSELPSPYDEPRPGLLRRIFRP